MKKKALLWALLISLLLADIPALAYRTERIPLRDTTPYASTTYTRFRDVPSTYWGKEGISYVVDKGLFNGTSDDQFSPNEPISLAMLCTVLYRFGGSPSVDEKSIYTDFETRCHDQYLDGYYAIQKGKWYTDAMVWALKNEIFYFTRIYKPSAYSLKPSDSITRAEFCDMLRNFYAYSGGRRVNDYISDIQLETTYKDMRGATLDNRGIGMLWAYTYGIIDGTSDSAMSPDMLVTRAQTAAMLERYARQFGMGKPIDQPAPEGYKNNWMSYTWGATDDKAVEEHIVQLINDYRADNGLPALKVNDKLMDAADIRAREQAKNISLTRPNGTAAKTVLEDVGLTAWTLTKELTAKSYDRGNDVVSTWKKSSELNAAMLTTDTAVELGVSYMPDGISTVALFAAGRSDGQRTENVSAPQGLGQQTANPQKAETPTSEPAQIPEEAKVDPAPQDIAQRQLTITGKTYSLGMTVKELTDLAGQPDATVSSSAGSTWYIFGTKTYLDFFLADVLDGKVVRLASGGKAFSYQGSNAGTKGVTAPSSCVRLYTDSNDGGILHAVMLREDMARGTTFDEDSLRGESIVNFHMTNAFRVYHGLTPYRWSEAAAKSARLHSADMAKKNYFNHYSLDGRSPWTRMEAQGIRWVNVAENISAGRSNGVDTYDGWVNSSGHRDNMLGSCEELGVGAGYDPASAYRWYMTQNFYTSA